ncbi:hypothetical protein H2200_002668 [Cladophialophora chaetospira]|uniref:DUF6604 domain-containing protein n=1 Tax=Cladophialophora chaetospira TaxID=386627 RepID=A0AA38XK84_9EURO|nr:hypothetical protein H2200_002668 [Cladophialophora chaetospira]
MDPTITAPGSYQQYKNDTAVFLTWVSQAAQACGWASNVSKQTSPTVEQPPESSAAGPTNLRVREILEQAQCIVKSISTTLYLPQAVARLARRAISTRRAFTRRFSSLDLANRPTQDPRDLPVAHSNKTHEFFTDTLQEALELLEICTSSQSDHSREVPVPVDAEVELKNRFSLLEVEDCEDYEEVSSYLQNQDQSTEPRISGPASAASPDDVMVDADDIYMRIFCFFEDMNALRKQLLDTWSSYQQGSRDIVSVTMATNAAIALVEQMDLELMRDLAPVKSLEQAFGPLGSDPGDSITLYTSILSAVMTGTHFEPFQCYNELGRWLFTDIVVILAKFLQGVTLHRRMQGSLSRTKPTKHDERAKSPGVWPHIYTMEASANICLADPFAFFEHPKFKELQEMDNSLTPILMDTCIRKVLVQKIQTDSPEKSSARAMHIDQFTHSLMKVKCPPLQTDTVFAVAVLRDIHTVLGEDVSKPLLELKNYIGDCLSRVSYSLAGHPDPADPLVFDADVHLLDCIEGALYFVSDESTGWDTVKASTPQQQPDESFRMDEAELQYAAAVIRLQNADKAVIENRTSHLASLEQPYILPSRDHELVWKGNPLACGTAILNLALATEQAGICLANYHLTIVWTAQLYAAMQQRKLLQGRWEELDKLIQVHISPLFFGSLPKSAKKSYYTFMMRIGATPSGGKFKKSEVLSVKALGGDRTGMKPRLQAKASCLSISSTAIALCPWFDGQESLIRTVHNIHAIMKKGSSRKPVRFDTLNFLGAFCDHLSNDFDHFSINYFGLTKFCSGMLQAFLDTERVPPLTNVSLSKENRRKRLKESQTDGFVPFLPALCQILQEDMYWEERQSQVRKHAKANLAERANGASIIKWDSPTSLVERAKVLCNGQESVLEVSHESHIVAASEFFQEYLDAKGVLSRTVPADDTAAQDSAVSSESSGLGLTSETASAGEKSTYRKPWVEDESSDEDTVAVSGRGDSELAAGEVLFDP